MYSIKDISLQLKGVVGDRAEKNVQNWLSVVPFADNIIFNTFYEREYRTPETPVMGFAGEFPGKLLTGLAECYRLNRGDERLLSAARYIVRQLEKTQGEDGYLGQYCKSARYVGSPQVRSWDIWSVYHCMYGLLQWYLVSGDETAWEVCRRSADGMCRFFEEGTHTLQEADCYDANGAGGRIFCLLYEQTGEERYWRMARRFESLWEETEGGGHFVTNGEKRLSFHLGEQHRWESLHALMQISDMGRITGKNNYKDVFMFYWEDIYRHDVHTTGGYSAREGSSGDPCSLSGVELCCSITWAAMTVEYLKITDKSIVADELERSFYNVLLGSQNPTGRWWTYSTPSCGHKKPNVDIVVRDGFHFDGCHEINCCAANAARGIGLLSSWAAMQKDDTLFLNYYGAGDMIIPMAEQTVILRQQTEYPKNGHVVLTVLPEKNVTMNLQLRIPSWSEKTKVSVNGVMYSATAGTYLSIHREWKVGDRIELEFDMKLHFYHGNDTVKNQSAIYYGPLLLAFDKSDNPDFPRERMKVDTDNDYQPHGNLLLTLDDVSFDAQQLSLEMVEDCGYPQPWVKFCLQDERKENIFLIDYANAGMSGDWFTTWFDIHNFLEDAVVVENGKKE